MVFKRRYIDFAKKVDPKFLGLNSSTLNGDKIPKPDVIVMPCSPRGKGAQATLIRAALVSTARCASEGSNVCVSAVSVAG